MHMVFSKTLMYFKLTSYAVLYVFIICNSCKLKVQKYRFHNKHIIEHYTYLITRYHLHSYILQLSTLDQVLQYPLPWRTPSFNINGTIHSWICYELFY